jgi:type I restriction enzyme R subunit
MRIAVKKILRKHGYPPDMELKATETVLEQAKLMANNFSDRKIYDNRFEEFSMAAEPE